MVGGCDKNTLVRPYREAKAATSTTSDDTRVRYIIEFVRICCVELSRSAWCT